MSYRTTATTSLPCQLILAERWTNYVAVAGDYAALDDGCGPDERYDGYDDWAAAAAAAAGDEGNDRETSGCHSPETAVDLHFWLHCALHHLLPADHC